LDAWLNFLRYWQVEARTFEFVQTLDPERLLHCTWQLLTVLQNALSSYTNPVASWQEQAQ
jgi:hypothetical protein